MVAETDGSDEINHHDRVRARLEQALEGNPGLRPFVDFEQPIEEILHGLGQNSVKLDGTIIEHVLLDSIHAKKELEESATVETEIEVSPSGTVFQQNNVNAPTDEQMKKILEAINTGNWIPGHLPSPYPCRECGARHSMNRMCTTGVYDIINFRDLQKITVCRICAPQISQWPGVPICQQGSDIFPMVLTIKNRVNPLNVFSSQL